MKITPATRTAAITYAIRDIAVKAQALEKQGKKLLYLNVGDPPVYAYDTPTHIKEALKAAIDHDGSEHRKVATYSDSLGLAEGRAAVAAHLAARGVDATAEDVLLTTGASEAITLSVQALVNPGENLLVPLPNYPLYNAALALAGGEPNYYALDEDRGWQVDVARLEKLVNGKTRGIVLINPNNPTGAVLTEETLTAIAAFAKRHGLVIMSDEIYDQLVLDEDAQHHPMAAIARSPVLAFGGLSKNYIMPGYRVGWIHTHDPDGEMTAYADAIKQLLRARLSAPHLQQHAIKAALEGEHDFLETVLASIREKRDLTHERLNAIPGITCTKPGGSFYVFPRIELPPGATDKEYVEGLLEAGVVTVYGSGFGMREQEKDGRRYGHFRIIYLAEREQLEAAYDAIAAYTARFYEEHGHTPKDL